jgi:hypothetical protein
MSPETPNSPDTPKLSIVPPLPETVVAREDGGNPLLNTPEEVAALSAQQQADGRTAELQEAMDVYNAEQPFVAEIPAEVVAPVPQSVLDSQNLIAAAADSVRRWSDEAAQQPKPMDPANEIVVPDFVKPAVPAEPAVTPEVPPQV